VPRAETRIALCQILVIDSDRESNFRRIDYALETARNGKADIAVFPESSILGWENPDAHDLAVPIPGADSERISDLARKYGVMIAIGLDEKDGDRLYDSAILVDGSGALLWKHRKINVLPELMMPPYSEGKPEDIGVVETSFGRVGLVICADTFTDHHFERLQRLNPDLLLVPYGWAAQPSDWPAHSKDLEVLVTRRAAQIRCPIVGVNLVGQMTHGPWKGRTYGGASLAVDSDGRVLRLLRDRDVEVAVVTVP
jgi:N-carbamoylputrescine amidase